MRKRRADVFEEQGAAADRALPMTVEPAARDARQIQRNEQRGDAAGARLDRSRAAEHDRRVGLVGGGDRGLLAVEDIVAAVALDAQAEVGRVGAAARLRQRERDQRFALRQPPQPWPDQFWLAVTRKNLAVQRREEIDVGHAEVGARDLLMDDAGGEAAHAEAAERLRQFGGDESHRAHLRHQRPVENARPIPLLKSGGDASDREAAGLFGERHQIAVEVGIHGPHFTNLRNSGFRFSSSALTPSRDSSVS